MSWSWRSVASRVVRSKEFFPSTEPNPPLAGAMMALVPPVIVIIFMQRWFVKGLIETEK